VSVSELSIYQFKGYERTRAAASDNDDGENKDDEDQELIEIAVVARVTGLQILPWG
jgi:hypothetical protein